MEATFFIDESGNTGTDWLNKDQPFFTYGGWLIPNEKIEIINQFLQGYIEKEQSDELKSNKILKRSDGLEIFERIYNTFIFEFSAIPIFIVVDKEFMVAAKIVETFFDCAYNPNINEYLTHPVELKTAIANCIVNSQDKTLLNSFSTLIKKGTMRVEALKEFNFKLVRLFEEAGHEQVANTLRNLNEKNLLSMIDEFETVTQNGKIKNRITLTQTMLQEMLKNVEIYANIKNISVNVNHDKLRGYSEVFKEIEDKFLQEEEPFVYQNETTIWLSKFPHIKSIVISDSKNVPCIQAADMLCGFLAKSFQLISEMKNLKKIEKEILRNLISLPEIYLCDIWKWYAPYNFQRKLILSLKPNSKPQPIDYNKIINEDFPKALSPKDSTLDFHTKNAIVYGSNQK